VAKKKRLKRPAILTPPRPAWPRSGTPSSEFTEGEMYGLGLNPAPTGIGRYPRTVADSDWVRTVVAAVDRYGVEPVFRDMLTIIRLTVNTWGRWDEDLEERLPPTPRAEYEIPEPTPVPSDLSAWNVESVNCLCLLVDPTFTGLGPYDRVIDERMWLRGVRRSVGLCGLKQTLVDILERLRESFGVPGERAPWPRDLVEQVRRHMQ
jgi:hypothetical protein